MSYQNIHYAKKCTLTCYKRHEIVPVILSVVFDSRVLDFDEVCFSYIKFRKLARQRSVTAYNLAYANSKLNLNYPCNKLACYFRKICARIFCTRIIPIGVALKNICIHGTKSTVSFGYIRKKRMKL